MQINPNLSDGYFILFYSFYIIISCTMITMRVRIGFHERSGLRKIHMPKISILAQCCCVRSRAGQTCQNTRYLGNVSRTDVCIHMIYFCSKWVHVMCIYIIMCTLQWTDKLQNNFCEYCYLQSVT